VTNAKPPTSSTDVTELLTPASPRTTLQLHTICLLKTAVTTVVAGNRKASANILFDEGVQRSFKSTNMVEELGISPTASTGISLVSFGTASRTHQRLPVTTIEVETTNE